MRNFLLNLCFAIIFLLSFAMTSCADNTVTLPKKEDTIASPDVGNADTSPDISNTDASPDVGNAGTPPDAHPAKPKLTVAYYNTVADQVSGTSFFEIEVEEMWSELHPDTELDFVNYGDKSDPSGLNYTTRMATMLMSGTAPDVIVNDFLRLDKLFDGGYCEDLYPYIEADPDIDIDDYFPNIISATEHGGKLFALPLGVSPTTVLVTVNKDYVDTVKAVMGDKPTINYLEMIQCYEAVMKRSDAPDDFYISDMWTRDGAWNGYRVVTNMESSRFLDISSGTVDFGEGFIEAMNTITPYLFDSDQLQYSDSIFAVNTLFIQSGSYALVTNYIEYGEPLIQHIMPFMVENTEGNMPHTHWVSYMINSQSDMKDEAWEFIKYMSTDREMQKEHLNIMGLPARMSDFRDIITSVVIETGPWIFHYDLEGYGAMTWAERADHKEWLVELEKEFVEPANRLADRLEKVAWSFDNYYTYAYVDVSDEYLSLSTGIRTVEQLAQVLQEKYTLYLSQ